MTVTDRPAVPHQVAQWIATFLDKGWSGSLTLHFNRGIILSYEPKPNLKVDDRIA